jgi:crotonobetainyl-CoA:carnitine CoA-transferase CaiB-like acyl-CoA transferase
LIDIALVDSMIRFISCRVVPYLGSGELPVRSGGRDSVIAVYQSFKTADYPITLGLGSDSIWRRFWSAVGMPEYALRPGLASNAERRVRRAEVVNDIQAILETRSRSDWLAIFAAQRIPAGPINRIDEVALDPEFHSRGLIYSLDCEGQSIPQVGTGFLVDGEFNIPRYPPPRVGAQTREILVAMLGYNEARVCALESAAII